MNISTIILVAIALTLLIYSGIVCVIYLITGKKSIPFWFGVGIVGIVVYAVSYVVNKIVRWYKYRLGKRTIIEDIKTGNKYRCKTNDDILRQLLINEYRVALRWGKKSDWKDVPEIPKEIRAKITERREHLNSIIYDRCDDC